MNYKSTYENIYGEKPKVEDNFIILKQKKFRDIPYSQYFTQEGIEFLENWLKINDSEEFIKRIWVAIRDMHTVIKNQEIPTGTTSSFFLPKLGEASKPPRFDKIESAIRYSDLKNRSRSI